MRFLPFLAVSGLLTLAACTQDPAEVTYRGDEFYGRSREIALDNPKHETYPEDSPRIKKDYARSVEPAKVESVAITDLPPPSPQGNAPAPLTPPAPAKPAVAATSPSEPAAPGEPAPEPAAQKKDAKFIWPVADGKVISRFGPKPGGGRSNDGINIAVAEGEPIWAAAAGTVVYAGSELKGYGNMVIIRHGGGWMTAYAHARSLAVKKAATVKQGDIIGYVGMTGGVKTPQLHFAMRDGKTPVDPQLYLSK